MNDKPYLFFLDMREIRQTLKICVKQCPTKTISSTNELYRYYKDTDSQYCRYDFDMTLLMDVQNDQKSDYFHFLGPCPPLPVYERFVIIDFFLMYYLFNTKKLLKKQINSSSLYSKYKRCSRCSSKRYVQHFKFMGSCTTIFSRYIQNMAFNNIDLSSQFRYK